MLQHNETRKGDDESWISDIPTDIKQVKFIKKIKAQIEKLKLEIKTNIKPIQFIKKIKNKLKN